MPPVTVLNYPVHTRVVGSVRYQNGTAPPVHICKCIAHSAPFRSDPRTSNLWGLFRNKLFWHSLVSSVCNVDRWIGTVTEHVWTHAVPYHSKLYRNSLYQYGTTPEVDRVNDSLIYFYACCIPKDEFAKWSICCLCYIVKIFLRIMWFKWRKSANVILVWYSFDKVSKKVSFF